ncbi:excinuclease ABC subunit UvrC [Candidatus Peregrinibacteria bacterium]|nr:excinuclease ABC subunit UvrC [Candidatus Peregrinibacteria bacterium]
MPDKKTKKKLDAVKKALPSTPGVYKFLGDGKVLYVGKAKNLKNRLQTYFRKDDKRSQRIKSLMEKAEDLEYIEVDSELEAFILETNLIKELKPKYNVLMKDDKNYAYIKITQDEDFPRVSVVRKMEKDSARYFGPKTSATAARDTIDLLHKLFRFRNCKLCIKSLPNNKVEVTNKVISYPCLEYHIKRCDAPCLGKITPEEYQRNITEIIAFLQGKHDKVIEQLKVRMSEAAASKNFEFAAKLRDKLLAVEKVQERQKISEATHENRDVISFVFRSDKAFFNVFVVRDGKLINQENFTVDTKLKNLFDPEDIDLRSEILERFMKNYYESTTDFPSEILVSEEEIDTEFLETWLSVEAERKVKIHVPKKGKKSGLLALSLKNAESFAKQCQVKWDTEDARTVGACNELAEALKLDAPPKRIECFDISHISGHETVASMVVFENGKPCKSDYRHFTIKTLEGGEIDDFKAMEEALARRLKYLPKEKIERLRILRQEDEKKKTIDFIATIPKEIKRKGKKPEKTRETIGEVKLSQIAKHYVASNFKFNSNALVDNLLEKLVKEVPAPKFYLITDNPEFFLKYGFEEIKIFPKEIKVKKTEKILAFYRSKQLKKDKSFTSAPNLIVIDGGKGQLSSALKALKETGLDLNLCSLAKKQEDVYVPEKSFPIHLEKDSQAQYLLQRLRDEAHRFAITHNRKRREKGMFS